MCCCIITIKTKKQAAIHFTRTTYHNTKLLTKKNNKMFRHSYSSLFTAKANQFYDIYQPHSPQITSSKLLAVHPPNSSSIQTDLSVESPIVYHHTNMISSNSALYNLQQLGQQMNLHNVSAQQLIDLLIQNATSKSKSVI